MLHTIIYGLGRTTALSFLATQVVFLEVSDKPETQARRCQEIAKTILAFLPGRNYIYGSVLIGACSLGALAKYDSDNGTDYCKRAFRKLDLILMFVLPVLAGIYQLSQDTTYIVFKQRLVRQELGIEEM